MAIPTALANFDGDVTVLTREGLESLNTSGPVRFVPGPNGIPAGINLVRNPIFKTDLSQWSVGTNSWDRIAGGTPVGNHYLRITKNTDDGLGAGTFPIGITYLPGYTYVITAWLKNDPLNSKHARPYLTMQSAGGSASTSDFDLTDDWEPYTHVVTVPLTSTPGNFGVNSGRNQTTGEHGTGASYLLAGVQIEVGDTATPFIHEDMGPGYGVAPDGSHYREAWAIVGAVEVWEDTTNHFINPDAVDNTAGATTFNATISQESEGDKTFFRTVRDIAGWYGLSSDRSQSPHNAQAGQEWTISAEARSVGIDGQVLVRHRWQLIGGGFEVQTANSFVLPANEWVPIEGTLPAVPDTNDLVFQFFDTSSGSPIGSAMDFRRIQVEQKPYKTPTCPAYDRDGILIPGHSWSGAENGSASTRAKAKVSLSPSPIQAGKPFSMAMRFKVDHINTTYNQPLWGGAISSGNGRNDLVFQNDAVTYVTGQGVLMKEVPYPVQVGEYYTVYLGVDGTYGKMCVEDEIREWDDMPTDVTPKTTLEIGWRNLGTLSSERFLNGAVGSLVFFDRLLRDSEWEALRNADTWEWPGLIRSVSGVLMGGTTGGGIGSDDRPVLVGGVIMEEG